MRQLTVKINLIATLLPAGILLIILGFFVGTYYQKKQYTKEVHQEIVALKNTITYLRMIMANSGDIDSMKEFLSDKEITLPKEKISKWKSTVLANIQLLKLVLEKPKDQEQREKFTKALAEYEIILDRLKEY